MLLRFAVSNFRSIRDEQELSMVAAQAIKDDPAALIETPALRKDKVLPAALIYGANASGKSNVVAALRFMQRMVLISHRSWRPSEPLPYAPFRLDRNWLEKESRFDLTFVHQDVRYQYGFSFLNGRFESEWLYYWPSGVRVELFIRQGQNFTFGRFLKGANQKFATLTKPENLFLSVGFVYGHEQFASIYFFFATLRFDGEASPDLERITNRYDQNIHPLVMKILKAMNVGIVDFRIVQNEVDAIDSEKPEPPVDASKTSKKIRVLQLGHARQDGELEFFDLAAESAGTLRLLSFLAIALNALDKGGVVIIDHLDSSLHTLACKLLLGLFDSPITNPNGAQLIATTHDTNFLKPDMLRRDQIWFTEKDDAGATHLYPLTDIRTRKGDNIEKGYLQARFGAVPLEDVIARCINSDCTSSPADQ